MSANQNIKVAKRRGTPRAAGGQKVSERKSGITETNYQFDYSNFRDVEKFSLNKKFLHSEIGKALGEVANIIAYGEHFVFYAPDRPDPADWEDEFDGPRVKLEYSTEYGQFIKRKSAYESKCTQAYHMMKARCSPSMWNAIKEHPDFEQWDRDQDALSLWLRIQDISLNGTGLPENDSKKKNEARHRYDRVHQRQNESVGDFYSRFMEHYDAMVSQGAYLIQIIIPEDLDEDQLEEVRDQHRVDDEGDVLPHQIGQGPDSVPYSMI
jgi:hypothetical protein